MKKTVAQQLAESQKASGIDKVFGLPGGETVELLDEVRRHDIDFVLVRNESSAVFMADSYAQVTRKPAVCMVTLGPGAANAVMGTAHSYLDRTPVIIITAQKPDSQLIGYTHQIVDLQALYAPITKASIKVTALNASTVINEALTIAVSGRPGPVHLQLASDEAAKTVDEAEDTPVKTVSFDPVTVMPDSADIQRAKQLIQSAERPVIVVGLGLEPQAPYTELLAFAEALYAPVITTPKAKGAIPSDHPFYAGTIGLTRNEAVGRLLNEADCILAIGFDVVELVQKWNYSGALIWISGWVNEDPVLPTTLELIGNIAHILSRLTDLPPSSRDFWITMHVSLFKHDQESDTLPNPIPGRLSPQGVLRIMREQTEPDAFLAVDVGSHKIFSSVEWQVNTPNRFLVSNGLSSMSYALPAAIGAIEASPESQALCLTGDAGLAMNIGELGVMTDRSLPVVVILLNDGAIDLIRSHQRRAGKQVFGTEFTPPNYCDAATAFGLRACRVESDEDFAEALSAYLTERGPALIEVMLDPSSYPTTPKQ